MRNPLKRQVQPGTRKMTLRERAALLKASASRVIGRRPVVHPTYQPSAETLPANTTLDREEDAFRSHRHPSQERGEGVADETSRNGAGKDGRPRSEKDMGRHETFDTALPLNLHVLNALAHPKEASSTEDNDRTEDPAETIIARHKAAFAVARPLLDQWSDTVPNTAAWDAAEAAMKGPNAIESELFDDLLETDASTLDGLLALAEYLPGAVKADGIDADMCAVPMKALETICRNLKWLARQGRVLPHARRMPDPQQPILDVPSNLSAACDWAVQHIDWMNRTDINRDWTDEQSEVEWKKSDDVWTRALYEPALDLATLAAKARMLRQDWLNEHARAEIDGDGRVRLALRVLNDAITLADAQGSEAQVASTRPLIEAMQKEWLTFGALGDNEPDEAYDDCTLRRFALIEAADRLPATKDALVPKALALAWLDYVEHWHRDRKRSDYGTDGRLALDIHAIMANGAPPADMAEADPVIAAIAASRAAEADIKVWSQRVSKRSGKLTRADHAEEDRLCMLQSRTRDIALSTVPTTQSGRFALVEFIRFVMDLYGMTGADDPPADNFHMWVQIHASLMAALAAPVIKPVAAERPDFSGFTLSQLGAMHEIVKNLWLHTSGELQAPWCWKADRSDNNVAGNFLDAESERLAHYLDAIRDETSRRVPADDEERNQVLTIRLMHAISGGSVIDDPELMADVARAWGA